MELQEEIVEEEMIQLAITVPEAAILSALSSVGVKVVTNNASGTIEILLITKKVIDMYPKSAISLARKMITLGKVSREIILKEQQTK